MAKSYSNTVAFLETGDEVQALIAAGRAGTCTAIAMTPSADFAASQAGIAYLNVEDLYDEQELLALGDANFLRLATLCHELDAILGVNAGEKTPIFSASYYSFSLKLFLDGLSHAIFVVAKCLNRLQPTEVLYCSTDAVYPTSESGFIDTQKLYAPAISLICANRSLNCVSLTTDLIDDAQPPKKTNLLNRIPSQLRKLGYELARNALSSARRLGKNDGRAVLVHRIWCDDGYDKLKKSGVRVVPISTLASDDRSLAFTSPDLQRLRPYFLIDTVDAFTLALPFLTEVVCGWRARHTRLVEVYIKAFSREKHPVVLGAGPIAIGHVAAVVAARRLGIARISVQHGGFNGYAEFPVIYLHDLYLSDHYACWGEGVSTGLATIPENPVGQEFRQPITFHATGSARLYALRQKLRLQPPPTPNKRKRVVYVMTGLPGSFRYFSGNLYPDILTWRMQRRVIELLLQNPDIDLTLKPGRSDTTHNPLSDWLGQQNAPGLITRSDVSLSQLLEEQAFDLVISDAPATSLLEALCSRANVVALFLESHLQVDRQAMDLLKRRAAVSPSIEAYLADIKNALNVVTPQPPTEPDDLFLERYGLGNAGDPADNFKQLVCNVT